MNYKKIIYADISEKLNVPWGPGLLGKIAMYFPTGARDEGTKIMSINDVKVAGSDGGDYAYKMNYVGSRGPYAFFKNYDTLIGKKLVIDMDSKGILTSVDRGVYKTDQNRSFNAENYALFSIGAEVRLKTK